MVAEEDVLVGWNIVQTVIVEHRRGGAARIELHHLGGDEQAVIAVGDQVNGHCRDHDPQGIDRFATAQGDDTQRAGSQDCQHQPREVA